MRIAGMITEYDPLHAGHLLLMQRTRELLGEDTALICVMSGNFVQRGEFAVTGKFSRAEAAVRSGANLVLELPLPWAVSSAERFADGGVAVLEKTGLVTHLTFGSECGDAAALARTAAGLERPEFSAFLKEELGQGVSFAAARQRAAERLLDGKDAALLSSPNNLLGVEYCKALMRRNSAIVPVSIRREGAAHNAETVDGIASASAIRDLLRDGRTPEALSLMAPAMRKTFAREEAALRAPVFSSRCERAILARLRTMTREEFAALDEGEEGLGNRLYQGVRRASTLSELLETVKTKRYAYARLRRMVLWAYLGLTPGDCPKEPPYLRVLAADAAGCRLLAAMRKCAAVPVLTKPADVRKLPPEARELFAREVRATDLYTLAYPSLSAAEGGSEWRVGPVIVQTPDKE